MSESPFFSGHEVISNHGSSSGIIPRFLNQPMDIANFGLDKENSEKIFNDFLKRNIKDFTDFYDLHKEIVENYADFINGLKNGKYFSINVKKQFSLDRSVEIKLHSTIKKFYIQGRLLVNNFAKSKIIDSEHFILNNFFIVTDKNFEKNKNLYFENDPSKKFEILINIIEDARKNFLNTFNQIRADFEHQNLEIPKVKVNTETGEITEVGITSNATLLEEVNYVYNYMLNMLENLMVFYFGILAIDKNPMMGVFESENYDYSKFSYRFVIFPRVKMQGFKLII